MASGFNTAVWSEALVAALAKTMKIYPHPGSSGWSVIHTLDDQSRARVARLKAFLDVYADDVAASDGEVRYIVGGKVTGVVRVRMLAAPDGHFPTELWIITDLLQAAE